jgi:hypothetical protein
MLALVAKILLQYAADKRSVMSSSTQRKTAKTVANTDVTLYYSVFTKMGFLIYAFLLQSPLASTNMFSDKTV